MKRLYTTGAIASLALVATGFFQLGRLGLSAGGATCFFAAAVAAFCVSLAVYVFHLRDRIAALEAQSRAGP